ncbi:hypothetical protein ACLOJK_032146 [Asimina triloba]
MKRLRLRPRLRRKIKKEKREREADKEDQNGERKREGTTNVAGYFWIIKKIGRVSYKEWNSFPSDLFGSAPTTSDDSGHMRHAALVIVCIAIKGTMKDHVSYVAMIIVQLAYGGSNILTKLALQRGMNCLAFIVYRHLIAMLILGPIAYFIERKHRPPLSVSILMKIFLLASLGITIHQNLYYIGLNYSSPTVASALSNVIPSLTFILAVLLRMEEVRIRTVGGRIKLLGTSICVGGALIFILYRGYLFNSIVRSPLIDISGKHSGGLRHIKNDWIKGSALILTSHIAYSGWLIFQVKVFEVYPARFSMNTLMCFFASLQCSVVAIAFDRSTASWRLQWNIQLLTIVCCGVVISGLVYYLQTWCISEKGPVFTAMFSPLLIVFVGIFSAIVFAERLHLGSVIGAFFIVVGLFCVLWAKNKDIHFSKNKGKLGQETSVESQIEEKQTKGQSLPTQISLENHHNQISDDDKHVIVPIK